MLDPSPPAINELSDKTIHFLSFVAMSAATVGFCRSIREFVAAGLFCAAAGVAFELGQSLIPTRAFEHGDIVANLSGTAVGMLLAIAAFGILNRRWRFA